MAKGISTAPGTVNEIIFFAPSSLNLPIHPFSNSSTIIAFHSVFTTTTQASFERMPVLFLRLLLLTSPICIKRSRQERNEEDQGNFYSSFVIPCALFIIPLYTLPTLPN